jgi:DNA adenine methylase
MDYYSPLRYPGGKGNLAPFFQCVVKGNCLCDGYYVEPFAGGCSIALSLLINEYARRIVINDLDKAIFAFWYSILNCTDEFCRMVEKTPLTIKEWKKQRAISRKLQRQDLLTLGFSTFFLNRTNRSGILNGGVIGGLAQTGDYQIDARFNKPELIYRIERIASYRDRISLYNMDGCDLLKMIAPITPKRTLFYLDPPYYTKGKDLYQNYFKHEDHEQVAKVVKTIRIGHWIVSYDNRNEIRKMYSDCRSREYSLDYSAQERKKGKELMFFSENVLIPFEATRVLKN